MDEFSTPAKKHRKLTLDWSREIQILENLRYKSKYAGLRVHPGFNQFEKPLCKFATGTSYIGEYDTLGFAGIGVYTYTHGVIYKGQFKDGQFHGKGTLTYPKGQQIEGVWDKGRLIRFTFKFADGLKYADPWKYCQLPYRRFQTEINEGLKPSGIEKLTNKSPSKPLCPQCYDTVDGYFDAQSKGVFTDQGMLLRSSTNKEEKHIKKNYRCGSDLPVLYRPDLYEYWTYGKRSDVAQIMSALEDVSSDETEDDSSSDISTASTALLSLY